MVDPVRPRRVPLERRLNGSDDRLATLDMRVVLKSKSSNLLQAFTKPLPIESQTPHIHLRFGLCWAGVIGRRCFAAGELASESGCCLERLVDRLRRPLGQ